MTHETVVLVPGLLCTRDLFAPQIAMLEAAGHPVVVPDHRADETIAAIAARILAGLPPRFALGGLSMGGYIAFEIMRQAPERVARLALLDTSARADTPEQTARREAYLELARSGRFEDVADTLWPLFVATRRHGDAELEGIVRAMMAQTGPEAFVRQTRAIASRPDSRALLEQIEIPTLVLVGDEDVLTPPEMSREIADAIEWASLAIVPECGHLATLERPEAVNRALAAWLAT